MKLTKRRHGSQRASKPMFLTIEPNWAGQGGFPSVVLVNENQFGKLYLSLECETEEEWRAFLSAVQTARMNAGDKR